MLRGLEGWHIVIIVALVVLLFGSRKLPDAARSVGQSLRIFKSEMKAAAKDGEPQVETQSRPVTPQPAVETKVTSTTVTPPTVTPPPVVHPTVTQPPVTDSVPHNSGVSQS